jgi:hypothetical protein
MTLYRDSVTRADRESLRAAGATITSEWQVMTGLTFSLRAIEVPAAVSRDGPLPDRRVQSAELDQPACLS